MPVDILLYLHSKQKETHKVLLFIEVHRVEDNTLAHGEDDPSSLTAAP